MFSNCRWYRAKAGCYYDVCEHPDFRNGVPVIKEDQFGKYIAYVPATCGEYKCPIGEW